MTQPEFQKDMARLTQTFGQNAYTTERAALVWREFGHLDGSAWTRVVDQLIGEHRQTPLMPEIRAAVAVERERGRSREKVEERATLTPDAFVGEEHKGLCAMIQDIVRGRCTLEQFESVLRGLKR